MVKFISIFFLLISTSVFSATERVVYTGSRTTLQVNLEEDFYQMFRYTEQIPVARTFCQDVPITQNYCEWVPGGRVCQTRPVCHPTPYGPRCIPTYGCYNTPPQQLCRPVTTVQRQCATRTVYESVTRTERRFVYRSKADVNLLFDSLPREYSSIEFDVNLFDDQLSFVSNDYGGPVIISKLLERRDRGRGNFERKYFVSALSREDYLMPISQIPELVSFYGDELNISIGSTRNSSDIKILLTLKHLRSGIQHSLEVKNPIISQNMNGLKIMLQDELGQLWRYWQNNIYWIDVKIVRQVDGEVINSDLMSPQSVQNRIFL